MNTGVKKLYRSTTNRMVGGICGGLGEYLGMDPTVVRLLFVLVTVLAGGFPGVAAYIVMLFVIPEEPTGGYTPPAPPAEPMP